MWADKATGQHYRLARRMPYTWVLRSTDGPASSPDGTTTERIVGRSEFLSAFRYVECTHDDHCCMQHGFHVMPHRACILR